MAIAEKRCTKCGEIKPLDRFAQRRDRKGGTAKQSSCKACQNAYTKAHYRANKEAYKARQAPYRLARQAKYREYTEKFRAKSRKLIDSLRTPCVACGDSKRPVMDFHHMDPPTKRFEMAHLPGCSEVNVRLEISKCITLCANCHRMFHAGDENVSRAVEQAYKQKRQEVA